MFTERFYLTRFPVYSIKIIRYASEELHYSLNKSRFTPTALCFNKEGSMTKSQLVGKMAEMIDGITQREAEVIVNTIFSSMKDALLRGKRIEIRGFGSIKVKSYKSYKGRNPKTAFCHRTQAATPISKPSAAKSLVLFGPLTQRSMITVARRKLGAWV